MVYTFNVTHDLAGLTFFYRVHINSGNGEFAHDVRLFTADAKQVPVSQIATDVLEMLVALDREDGPAGLTAALEKHHPGSTVVLV